MIFQTPLDSFLCATCRGRWNRTLNQCQACNYVLGARDNGQCKRCISLQASGIPQPSQTPHAPEAPQTPVLQADKLAALFQAASHEYQQDCKDEDGEEGTRPTRKRCDGQGKECGSCHTTDSNRCQISESYGQRLCSACHQRWKRLRMKCNSCKYAMGAKDHGTCPRCRNYYTPNDNSSGAAHNAITSSKLTAMDVKDVKDMPAHTSTMAAAAVNYRDTAPATCINTRCNFFGNKEFGGKCSKCARLVRTLKPRTLKRTHIDNAHTKNAARKTNEDSTPNHASYGAYKKTCNKCNITKIFGTESKCNWCPKCKKAHNKWTVSHFDLDLAPNMVSESMQEPQTKPSKEKEWTTITSPLSRKVPPFRGTVLYSS